ncbi:MAG TPA: hypothetical protein ENK95_02470 [Campylobacterales bacterium]|nr:hypothetical protein [Campylobacterales bacterium]
MRNVLLYSSLVILGLSTNACVKPEAMPTPANTQIDIEPTQEIQPLPTNIPSLSTEVQNDLPTHQLKTVQGSMLLISEKSNGFVFPQFENQIVLLQIFGKECEYCFEDMPFIQHLQSKYGSKLKVIALQAQEKMSDSKAQNIIQQFQLNYPIIDRDEGESLLRFINKTYGWSGILPYFLLVKEGITEYSFSGNINKQEFEEAIQSLL